MNWKNFVSVRPAAECFPSGDPAPDCVANYHVYFVHDPKERDPYLDGIVIEEWKDGTFYIIDGNTEVIDKDLAVVEVIAEGLARDNGWIDANGNVTVAAKTNETLAYEAIALPRGTREQIDAQDEFCRRVQARVSPAVFNEFENYANTEEIIEEGKRLLADSEVRYFAADCGVPSPPPTPDAVDALVESDSVQALYDSLFPNVIPRIRIRGGGKDMSIHSVCGAECAQTLCAAFAFASRDEVDWAKVARIAADACEVYING